MTKLVVDVDTGIDDSLALVFLLASPDADIVGIASTAGNVGVAQVAANNLAWLDVCQAPPIEVAVGSPVPLVIPLRTTEDTHGPQGIGFAELPPSGRAVSDRSAADMWADLVRSNPGEVTGLVTGPLTNLALALRIEPDLPHLLQRLVVMGGAFNYAGNTTPTTEWNISVDPEAAKVVFDAFSVVPPERRPIVCALDITERIEMRSEHLERLGARAGSSPAERVDATDPQHARSAASNPVVRHLSDAVRFYMTFHRQQGLGHISHMHDPFAAAVALDPSLVATRPATVDVELAGTLTRGMTVADWAGMWGRPPNVDIACDTNPDAFFDLLIERVGDFAARLYPPEGARP
ncbi:nucleoside hydrolase [Aldersonia sp. NBC_00410]|uniref:nucleoside hydrolase n=1 Tax=Aldersonia sp. NBC_00410 TaxID=2975954 RepID=UPI002255CBF5|nr:nucleoside hydrolase [Aldersonia sp. NBC_00410]MCX5046627.1 nucleoside hydrolase [Aldersonia sp. NBC_00410]